jgi:hypothetical protein
MCFLKVPSPLLLISLFVSVSFSLIGSDHPTPFAQGCPDSTPGAMYFPVNKKPLPASLQNIATRGHIGGVETAPDEYGAYPDPQLPPGWKSVGPLWGPIEMADELGCPPVDDEEEETPEEGVTEPSPEMPTRRQFNENDLTLKFQPREEFGGQRMGYIFRMGAQGLGYYEDSFSTAPISVAAVETKESS